MEKICDRVGVMGKGRLITVDKTKEIKKKYRTLEDYFVELVAGKNEGRNRKGPARGRSKRRRK